ncbi:hypothetical protein O181_108424 [Austropuccinia psidii MF-1]|uniref:Uncharacterized protein n=1 Tax=Austropuccinia psidii MF-1 TaxID=1389203 RepID=A0A9Q3JUR7_9BASI|nr:hypothetical protein [Austropuccinia psidii MF-1]
MWSCLKSSQVVTGDGLGCGIRDDPTGEAMAGLSMEKEVKMELWPRRAGSFLGYLELSYCGASWKEDCQDLPLSYGEAALPHGPRKSAFCQGHMGKKCPEQSYGPPGTQANLGLGGLQ